ncbi:hypothetical protein [Verrucomicrobium sp. GAS474]|uniref:hypothetical protein n=1 Tax=Verrucomicrobium sp. GAS474 TaxID=1882831 RepID=UPI000B81B8AF|nr:hypothetical protein [Verrucomicrobium sp. GAS474]
MLLCGTTSLRATQGGPLNVGYLVDEQFAYFGNPSTGDDKVSDWDIDSTGGTISSVYWKYASLGGALKMRKSFIPQATGSITLEFCFNLQAKIDGNIWAIRSGDTNAVVFKTSGGAFGYETSTGGFTALVANYAAQTNYAVRATLYPATHGFDVTVNGARAAGMPVAMRNTVSQVDSVYIETPAGLGEQQLYFVTVTKGYIVNERFTCATAGITPSGWGATTAGGLCSPQLLSTRTPIPNPKQPMGFRMDDTSTTAMATLNYSFTPNGSKLAWEYKFLLPAKVDGVIMYLRNGSSGGVTLTTSGGNIACYSTTSSTTTVWSNYVANVWYVVRVVLDPATDLADVYINGKYRTTIGYSGGNLSSMAFGTSMSGMGTMWIDDVLLYPFQERAADYVPDVAPISHGSLKVGMQTFFAGWRNGQHLGWDWIYRYPNHDPALGFYDEGNSEVMDWELKWMSEAGVDFFMDCWYGSTNGDPIKQPTFESTQGAIHEGYFYAKNTGNVQFAIADFSLSGATTTAAFQNAIVPYWVEYYFRDPRYMRIDNKAVVAFGNATDWVNGLGTATALAETNFLRTQISAAGYSGAILLARCGDANTAILSQLSAAGFDACYTYAWISNNITTIQSALTSQKTAGASATPHAIYPIGVSSQGRSGEAWDQTGPGYISPADFTTMNGWMKNTFAPSISSASATAAGGKMVLFDNWNEFGEGHYIAPTALLGYGATDGFGYLNGIRSVFLPASTVTNVVPTATQKARMNILYSRAWTGRTWAFDSIYPDTEGWMANFQVSSLDQQGGYLKGYSGGADPSIISADGYNIPTATYRHVEVRMQTVSSGTAARIYFTSNSDGTMSQAKSQAASTALVNDGAYHVYTFDMSTVPGWTGASAIRRLRFDPIDIGASASDVFSIDYIKVLP